MARLWARTSEFEAINVGDQLPILVKWDTRESIERFNARLLPDAPVEQESPEAPPDVADPPGVLEVPAARLSAYVVELLEKAFPSESVTRPGSDLKMEQVTPAHENDVISFSGSVVDKREEGSLRLVECRVRVENQGEQIVAWFTATVSF